MDLHTRTRTSLTQGELTEIFERIETHSYKGFRIRAVKHDGQRWIVFADICKVFGYLNPAHQLKYVVPEEIRKIDIGLKNTLANCVSQKAIVNLAMISNRNIASDFRKWADEEVFGNE